MFDELQDVLAQHRLKAPDGRPLHAYQLGDATRARLAARLRSRVLNGDTSSKTAAPFVLWAAERIRTGFTGGLISWKLVFDGLGLLPDQGLAQDLVDKGLAWWRRPVRKSEFGHRLFLYTLMAEGGIPDAVLREATHYRRALIGTVTEIESGGCIEDEALRLAVAMRWSQELPLTFRTEDAARLLADLAVALAQLRAELPADLPMDAADRWLDINRPDWASRLPLRMSSDVASGLIRGVLTADRADAVGSSGPVATRELRRSEGGAWSGWLRAKDRGTLGAAHLPGAEGLRLRHTSLISLHFKLISGAYPPISPPY